MKKGAKWVLGFTGFIIVAFIVLSMTGTINLIPQLALSTPDGDVDIDCNSFATCSPLLRDMGYSSDEINRILTTCNSVDGCVVMK